MKPPWLRLPGQNRATGIEFVCRIGAATLTVRVPRGSSARGEIPRARLKINLRAALAAAGEPEKWRRGHDSRTGLLRRTIRTPTALVTVAWPRNLIITGTTPGAELAELLRVGIARLPEPSREIA